MRNLEGSCVLQISNNQVGIRCRFDLLCSQCFTFFEIKINKKLLFDKTLVFMDIYINLGKSPALHQQRIEEENKNFYGIEKLMQRRFQKLSQRENKEFKNFKEKICLHNYLKDNKLE